MKNAPATRRKLLETSFELFYQHGFQSTGLDAILKASGFSKGALYNHFSNKHELGYAVVEEVLSPWILDFWRDQFAAHDNPIDALNRILNQLIDNPPEKFYTIGCPLNNLIQETADADEGFRLRLSAIVDEWILIIETNLRRGQFSGQVRPGVDPHELAVFLTASLEGGIGLTKSKHTPEYLAIVCSQLLEIVKAARQPSLSVNGEDAAEDTCHPSFQGRPVIPPK